MRASDYLLKEAGEMSDYIKSLKEKGINDGQIWSNLHSKFGNKGYQFGQKLKGVSNAKDTRMLIEDFRAQGMTPNEAKAAAEEQLRWEKEHKNKTNNTRPSLKESKINNTGNLNLGENGGLGVRTDTKPYDNSKIYDNIPVNKKQTSSEFVEDKTKPEETTKPEPTTNTNEQSTSPDVKTNTPKEEPGMWQKTKDWFKTSDGKLNKLKAGGVAGLGLTGLGAAGYLISKGNQSTNNTQQDNYQDQYAQQAYGY